MRAVIDTNVIFEGLTRKDGAPGLLIDDFKQAKASLGLDVLTPEEAVAALVKGG